MCSKIYVNLASKLAVKSDSMVKRNYGQAGRRQLHQLGSSGESHSTTDVQRVPREADGQVNVSPCSRHSPEVGYVYEATLSGLYPHQPWSPMLLTFSVFVMKAFLNCEHKDLSNHPEVAPTQIGSCQ